MVEESLRHDPPIHVLMRDCLADTTIEGVTIPAGVKVGFGLASANRDERTYERPDEFRLDRPNAKDHLAFGGGPHVCPGASLARLEGRIALDVFLDRVDTARVDDRLPTRTRSRVLGQWPATTSRQPDCAPLTVLVPGGPARTVGTYSTSWMRPSKVRLLIMSSATSG